MSSTDITREEEWYWCLAHQRPERSGQQCRAEDRLGPYPTEEAARNWQATRDEREEAWKRQDEEWEGERPPGE